MLFGAPWYLLGALGAVVPVLVHLFGRRRARRVLFPSLRLIKAAQRERTSLVRLRQVWLMVLRAAAILLLSLALARPTLPWVTARGGGDGALTVVLDDTLSMRTRGPGRTAFEVAKESVRGLLEGVAAGRPVRLLKVSEVGKAREGTAREVLGEVERAEAGYGAAGIEEALRRAEGEVWVFTDLQRTGWMADERPERAGMPAPPGTPTTIVDCGREARNLGVGRVEVVERPVLVGAAAVVGVSLTPSPSPIRPRTVDGRGESETVRVGLTVGGAALPVAEVAAGGRRVLFEWEPERSGALAVTAKLPPDALREDDEGFAVAEVREELRVLLVGTEAQTRHVRLALAPEEGGAVRVRVAGKATEEEMKQADAVGGWGGGGVGGSDPAHKSSERRGTSPRPTADPGMVLFTEGMSPEELARLAPGVQAGQVAALPSPLRLGWFEVFQGPLQAFGNPAAGDLQAVSFRARRGMEVGEGDWEVLARFEDGTPGVVGGSVDGARRVVINLALDPARSDLVSQPVFVPLVHRLFKHVARREFWEVEGVLVGDSVKLDGPDAVAEVACVDGKGESVPVNVEGGFWKVTPVRPGVHRLSWTEGAQKRTGLFAVNVDPRESDLRRIEAEELQKAGRRVVRPEAGREKAGVGPLRIATPLLVLAFLVLVAELVLAGRGKAFTG